jgi:hypothetical protein
MLNRLFLMVGATASAPGWSLTDTGLLINVVIGVLAAAVGTLPSPPPPSTTGRQEDQILGDHCRPVLADGPVRLQVEGIGGAGTSI